MTYPRSFAQELFERQWARYQARPQRTYSIAASGRRNLSSARALARRVLSQAGG